MKKFCLLLAVMLPLAGCPKKNKDNNGAQPATTPTDPDSDSQPASNRAAPATPSR
jgi:hypothetical protein